MRVKLIMRVKMEKVEPEEIFKSFTEENEKSENRILDNYFYLQDGVLNKMNNCEKFVLAYGQKFQMLKFVHSGIYVEEKVMEFQLEEVGPSFIAENILLKDNKEIFFHKPNWDLVSLVSSHYQLIENLKDSTFFMVRK